MIDGTQPAGGPRYCWSRRRVCYHKGVCPWAAWIRPKNYERGESRPADRRGCKICRPEG
jgi:hypothetical protein